MKYDLITCIDGAFESLTIPSSTQSQVPGALHTGAQGKILKALKSNGLYQNIGLTDDFLYEFESHTFTSAGVRGAYGPSLFQLLEAYETALWLEPDNNFEVVDGVQKWKVAETGLYQIEAQGAFGYVQQTQSARGRPAVVQATVGLKAGDILTMLVGQTGLGNLRTGGGTFVESADIGLIMAAGGGGCPSVGEGAAVAKFDIDTPQTSTAGGSGETVNSRTATAGAGYSADALPFSTVSVAKSFINGGTGASAGGRHGGFGGGGLSGHDTVYRLCGGGGGYSGGRNNYGNSGIGGTSFCSTHASVQDRSSRIAVFADDENGLVRITRIG